MAGKHWTEENTQILREMVADGGYSFEAIGQKIGMTRSACIGRAHRLGLEVRKKSWELPGHITFKQRLAIDREARRKLREERRNMARREARAEKPKTKREKKSLAPLPLPPVVAVNPLNLALDQLHHFHCRYITNDDMAHATYCGHPTHNESSWCEFHYRRVFESRAVAAERRAKWLASRPQMKKKRDAGLREAA